ncbi:MAG: alpha/beta fold hydrolase [Ignavibacteria bacterium]|nr:alpha/beta fold hydrolase [Ignavibacteria bacterium]
MNREYHRWHSPRLQRDMELLVFGHSGIPVIVFPTSHGAFYEYEDRGMVGCITDVLVRGGVQLFCVDSVNSESWYNYSAPPRWRIVRHMQYDDYLQHEVLPFVHMKNSSHLLYVTGCSFGGYHAVNFALRYPERVDACISMSGSFDIKPHITGYYDDDCYFHNPVDYLPNIHDERYLSLYRTKTRIILGTGEWDICLGANIQLSGMLHDKGVDHVLDVWGDHAVHDWPLWHGMIRKFLS